jgi:NAD(P)-dependent dehydrogenase (short-subunit alcohol dehydrogenase family)
MDLQLNEKKALVTGSTAGIGYATAKSLAREGAHVIINGRNYADVDEVASKLRQSTDNGFISGVAADFSKKEEVDGLIEKIPDLDILVNNVGIFNEVDFTDISDDEWFKMFEVNVMSGVRLARHYFPKMMEKDEGRIIFISSESAMNIPTEMIHYGMSKTAQLSISRGLARLTKGSDVTVNTVLPGPTWSRSLKEDMEAQAEETGQSIEKLTEDFFSEQRPTTLIDRFADIGEVANMVTYVASPLASATNGAALRVDGGVVNSII